ncbi:hypothetical protein ACJRO7_028994 [Eucalyptus globulus]|uniref:Wall-associated receptor kinase galacturonan-binding domain-containing protein n=1 Tax=Eucalyptus globulus TaxID=34317 RepID=A0ABD3K147_EUCGL
MPTATPAAALLLLAAALPLLPLSSAATRCPDCGSNPVPYPLSTSPTCGDQSYKVQCDAGGTLLFDTLNNSYPITSVDPENQRLVVQPASLLANTCVTSDLVHQGVQLNSSLPFNVTSSNTILFLNCTSTLLNSPLNCSSASLCHTYVNGTAGAAACGAAAICCTFRAGGSTTSYSIRVRDAGCRAYTSFVNLDPSEPVNLWPKPGMEIQWVLPPEPVCGAQSDCDGNATCRADPAGGGVSRCFCQPGLTWDPTQGVCVESLTSGIGVALLGAIVALLLYRRHRRIQEARERLTREHFNRATDDVNLAVYVQRMVEEERIMDVVDPMLKEQASTANVETMKALGFLAVGCLEERRQNRPSMKEVAEEIEYIMSVATAEVVES